MEIKFNKNIVKNISTDSDATERQSANWDIKNAPRNYASLVLAQGITAFFSLASVWLITKMLGSEGYGSIVALIAASQVVQVLINWTSLALSKFGTEEFIERGTIAKPFWTRTFFLIPNLFLAILIAFFGFEPLSHWLKIQVEVFPYVLAHFMVMVLWIHIQFALQGAKLMRQQGMLISIEKIIVFSILLILVATGNINWLSVLWAFIIAPIVMAFVGFWQLRNLIFPVRTFDFDYLKKMLLFSLPLFPHSLVGYFSTNYLDIFFVSYFLSKTEVGIYSINYQIAMLLTMIPGLAGNLLLPLFVTLHVGQKSDKANLYLTEILPFICFCWCLACAVFATLISVFLPLIFGENFVEHQLLFWILAAAGGLASPYLWGYSVMASAKSLTYITLTCAIVSAFTNLVLNYFLVLRFGLIGCAWATATAYFLSSTVAFALLNKHLGLKKTWAVQATIPILFGAIVGTWDNSVLVALIGTVFSSIIIFLIYRRRIFEAFGSVRSLFFKQKIFSQMSEERFPKHGKLIEKK